MAERSRAFASSTVAIVCLVAGLLACEPDARVPELEATRARLVETTVPKGVFWDQVQRKGAVAQERQKLEAEAAELRDAGSRLDAEVAALEAWLAQARTLAEAAEAELAEARAALAAAAAERARREDAWSALERRRRAGSAS